MDPSCRSLGRFLAAVRCHRDSPQSQLWRQKQQEGQGFGRESPKKPQLSSVSHRVQRCQTFATALCRPDLLAEAKSVTEDLSAISPSSPVTTEELFFLSPGRGFVSTSPQVPLVRSCSFAHVPHPLLLRTQVILIKNTEMAKTLT